MVLLLVLDVGNDARKVAAGYGQRTVAGLPEGPFGALQPVHEMARGALDPVQEVRDGDGGRQRTNEVGVVLDAVQGVDMNVEFGALAADVSIDLGFEERRETGRRSLVAQTRW